MSTFTMLAVTKSSPPLYEAVWPVVRSSTATAACPSSDLITEATAAESRCSASVAGEALTVGEALCAACPAFTGVAAAAAAQPAQETAAKVASAAISGKW